MKDIPNLKFEVSKNVFLYIQTKEDRYKTEALKALNDLSGCYYVKLKKVRSIDLNLALTQFLTNKSGIATYMNILYSSIQ